jgi:hypothetical protein
MRILDPFDTDVLRLNVKAMLQSAVETYNCAPGRAALTLDYRALSAGYGEHLFNEIARDIIGSDIANKAQVCKKSVTSDRIQQ